MASKGSKVGMMELWDMAQRGSAWAWLKFWEETMSNGWVEMSTENESAQREFGAWMEIRALQSARRQYKNALAWSVCD